MRGYFRGKICDEEVVGVVFESNVRRINTDTLIRLD